MEIKRGDTKRYRFKRHYEGGEVIQQQATKVYFTVKKDPDCKVIFQKSLGNGITYDTESNYYYINIKPEDTENVCPGVYGFDIEIIAGDVVTTVKVGKLTIGADYTRKGDRR